MSPEDFDLMNIYIMEGTNEEFLAKLNPNYDYVTEPVGDPAVAFSSGGFDVPAVWKNYLYDLSKYEGKDIQIVFEFDTEDLMYNAFRGWFIDTDIRVENVDSSYPDIIPVDNLVDSPDKAISPFSSSLMLSPQLPSRSLLMPEEY